MLGAGRLREAIGSSSLDSSPCRELRPEVDGAVEVGGGDMFGVD